MHKIYVIGGANIDIYAKPINKIVSNDSNPGQVSFSFGGVARNIAENMCNLGGEISFISCFGQDAYGQEMMTNLINKNISLTYSRVIKKENTSTYIAILDENDMYVAVNDMKILRHLTINYLNKLNKIIDDKDMVVFDSNLSLDTIKFIANKIKGYKVVDVISCNKVKKLQSSLDKIDILKMNIIEAEELNGNELKNDKDILAFTKRLNRLGTKEIIISSKNNLFIGVDEKLHCLHYGGYIKNPVNVTGAGDALLAGYAYSRFNDYDIFNSASIGIALSIFTVLDKNAVTKVSSRKIKNMIDDIKITTKEVK